MELVIGFLLGIPAGLLANYFSPPFSRFMARVFGSIAFKLNPDRFDLTGVWVAISEEPSSTDTTVRSRVEERIDLDHVGAVITGRSETVEAASPARRFFYEMRVSQNMVYGPYKKITRESGVQLGGGMIQMIIDLGRREMLGRVTWYDSDTKQIEHSAVVWKKL